MNLMKKILLACVLSATAVTVMASTAAPENGKEYLTLAQPQQTDSPGKIEVTEFFFYSCPHCNVLDPVITEWVKKQGNTISFKRVHVDFGQGQQPLQRMYYTLEAMGAGEALHTKIFHAIHVEHQFLRTDQDMLAFVTKNGVDQTKYLEISKSFAVEAKMRRAQSMQAAYKIDGVPSLFVDGHYMTSPSVLMGVNLGMAELDSSKADLLVLDALILKVQKERAAKK